MARIGVPCPSNTALPVRPWFVDATSTRRTVMPRRVPEAAFCLPRPAMNALHAVPHPPVAFSVPSVSSVPLC